MFVRAFSEDIQVDFYYPIQLSSTMMKLTAIIKYFLCDNRLSYCSNNHSFRIMTVLWVEIVQVLCFIL
jgi:hypothetical protein